MGSDDRHDPSGQRDDRIDGPTSVLVVDDAEQNRTLIAAWLVQRPGTRVVSVDGAGAAIACVRREHIDIVLLDMVMPGIDGYAAARLLRALPEARTIPIVAITAKVGEAERAACLAVGCSDYLSKPFDKRSLHELIDRLTRTPSSRVKAEVGAKIVLDQEMQALVPAYLENRRAEVSMLESALAQRDLETVRTIGHNLRGSGGSYGIPKLTEIGERIETAAQAADHATLAREIARLREHLTELLASMPQGR